LPSPENDDVAAGYAKQHRPKRSALISVVICAFCIFTGMSFCNSVSQLSIVTTHIGDTMLAVSEVFEEMDDGLSALSIDVAPRRLIGIDLAEAQNVASGYVDLGEKLGHVAIRMLSQLAYVVQTRLGISLAGLSSIWNADSSRGLTTTISFGKKGILIFAPS
jgi:hypothetical protein